MCLFAIIALALIFLTAPPSSCSRLYATAAVARRSTTPASAFGVLSAPHFKWAVFALAISLAAIAAFAIRRCCSRATTLDRYVPYWA